MLRSLSSLTAESGVTFLKNLGLHWRSAEFTAKDLSYRAATCLRRWSINFNSGFSLNLVSSLRHDRYSWLQYGQALHCRNSKILDGLPRVCLRGWQGQTLVYKSGLASTATRRATSSLCKIYRNLESVPSTTCNHSIVTFYLSIYLSTYVYTGNPIL